MSVKMSDWMHAVSDSTRLYELTIPGSHDTCTSVLQEVPGLSEFACTQTESLREQLEHGIRFIDIRCSLSNDDFALVHRWVPLGGLTFGPDVLAVCRQFLEDHPTETIIMSVKSEGDRSIDAAFAALFDTFVERYRRRDGSSLWYLGATVPTLGEVRGRIVLFRRFRYTGFSPRGLDASAWRNDTTFDIDSAAAPMAIQDRYDAPEIDEKLDRIRALFERAAGQEDARLYLNFCSAAPSLTRWITPRSYARSINPAVERYVGARPPARLGIVVTDFQHSSLIEALVGMNPYRFARLGDSGDAAGRASLVAATAPSESVLTTAIRTDSATLKLITWRVDPERIVRLVDSGGQAGVAHEIAAAQGDLLVTAIRTKTDTLKLISWAVDPAGTAIQRRGDSGDAAGAATLIRIASLTPKLFVTAIRSKSGRLKLMSWSLQPNGGFKRLADSGSSGDVVGEISLVALSPTRVATSVRNQRGELVVTVWSVASTGRFQRLGRASASGPVMNIASAVTPGGALIDALRDASGNLKLVAWAIAADGSIARLADSGSQAGPFEDGTLAVHGELVISAGRTTTGTLRLIAWRLRGDQLERLCDSGEQAGIASIVSLVALPSHDPAAAPVLATSFATAAGKLRVITWELRRRPTDAAPATPEDPAGPADPGLEVRRPPRAA